MAEEKKLNKEQLEAITYTNGPQLIIAGAGTGKTTVITHRIKHLIDSKVARPDQILAITFTEKAASEMETRLDELLPLGVTQTTINTFHGLCDHILRNDAFHIGLTQSYTLLTSAEVLGLVKKHIYDFELDYFRPLSTPDKFITNLLSHVDRLRDEDISPEQYSEFSNTLPNLSPEEKLEKQKYQEISSFYTKYQHLKIEKRVMDFADLIYYTLQLFRARPNILKVYQERWPYVLVDEYQDTNFSQTQLVNLISGPNPNLTVVADDDQSIYRWRGSSTSNVLKFTTDFPQAKKIILTQNFRSTQVILDAAYALITHNNPDRLEIQANIPKRLTSTRHVSSPAPVVHFHYSTSESEAEGIISEINRLKSDDAKLTYADFAILVRANSYVDPFIRNLERADIPYQFLGPSRLFDKPEIKDLIAYLRILVNTYDDTSLFRVISAPWADIAGNLVADLVSDSRRNTRPLIQVVRESSDKKLNKLVSVFDDHRQHLSTLSAGSILYDLLNRLDWLKALINYDSAAQETVATNIVRFFNKLKLHESGHSDTTVPSVVDWLDFLAEVGESPQATQIDTPLSDSVNLLTVHSAKGLEFKIVFLPSLVSLRFPSTNRQEAIPIPDTLVKEILPTGDAHLQEERRLFYVAMTRARDRLYLTSADYYGDAKRSKKPSIFIAEALGESKPVNFASSESILIPSTKSPPRVTPSLRSQPVDYLDYSRIQTFTTCPLHYKAKYLLHLSSPPSAASTFGNVIHKTLKDYYEHLKRGDAQDIHGLLDANWEHKGFGDPRRESKYKENGHRILDTFLKAQTPGSSLPTNLEEPFKFKLHNGLIIGGKIDRVDVLPDGRLHIIDYKTTSKKNQLDKKAAASDLQLSIYALAAVHLSHPPFNRSPENILLTLYYLDSGMSVDTTRTAAQLAASTDEILRVQKNIEDSDFSCSGSFICKEQKCDYSDLCNSS